MTSFPRWTTSTGPAGAPSVGQLDRPLPEGLAASLARTAVELRQPVATLLLAAHVRVLATLTGEAVVTTAHTVGHRTHPCTVAVGGSWRTLAAAVAQALETPPPQGTLAETVVGSGRAAARLPEGTQLAVSVHLHAEPGVLRLHCRREAIDAGYARRLAGYHVAALDQLATDPDGPVDAASLVSQEEIDEQLHALAGPTKDLPDRRVHELFEDHVRAHPDRPAAAATGREWTYAQLNDRANAIGRGLLDNGLAAEDVVAVVTERNLEWLAAVLAVLKAGGAYLPIDPSFPADRIARVLRRAGCRHVLTQEASRSALGQALASFAPADRPAAFDLDRLLKEAGTRSESGSEDVGLGTRVGPGRLAYLYFTSGSTGEPKGAMCEHAGMLNHVLAKIEDLGIGPGDTVAQTAPQCFDISLWQLLAALVAGGRTLIVAQEAILDVERFVDTVDAAGVAVLQVVPSYLEAVLTYLHTRRRTLPALRCLSVTGEALKAELAHRWFAAFPTTRLVNAYGLTETSDDTNHEVMHAPPIGSRVPLGPPIRNVRVYVVDERLVPVPLGAPGEIVFAGVCVGRGYVNDPERTARAYLVDPFHPGDRLYRGGDIGRWGPDGKLEFLGRRDHQVKISGFRIEIGEVEDALTRTPGVRDAAVVVADGPGRGRRLVGFYGADHALDAAQLRAQLAARLPAYMVPATVHHRPALPLTANGKIDRTALQMLAAELDDRGEDAPVAGAPDTSARPVTPTETRLAAAWAVVLGVPTAQIGRHDHFFDRGGTSLTAVKLAIALDRAVTLRDLLAHPVLAELARFVDEAAKPDRSADADDAPSALVPG